MLDWLGGQGKAAPTRGYIARAEDVQVGAQPHAPHERQQGMLDVQSRRRKVLKQSAAEVKSLGTLRKSS
jgi:hypothetical protein